MKVLIEYKKDQNCMNIKPMDFQLDKLRGITSYLKVIKGQIISPNLVSISLDEIDVNTLYTKIRRIFEEEFSCEIESNIGAKKVFDDAEDEANRFKIFSKKAKEIRNNEMNEDDFSDFCSVLSDTDFKRNLKVYQLLAAYHIAFSQNACNFSVPGSGKTSTVLAAYEYLKKQEGKNQIEKLVVFGPLSSFIAWKMEYEACFGVEPNSIEIRGGVKKQLLKENLMASKSECELLIISYGSVQGNYDIILHFLKHNNCMVVLDEAHRIKRVSDDAQSNYVLSLSPYAKSRVVLTGTPAANSYVDLYNLYKFIWPFNNVIGYSVPQLAAMSSNADDRRVEDLIDRISSFFIRVKKSDLNLPDPIFRKPEIVDMSPIQRSIYQSIEDMIVHRWEQSRLPESIRRAASIRLRQAASNPGLLLKSLEEENIDYEGDDNMSSQNENDIEIDKEIVSRIVQYKSLEVPNKFVVALNIAKELISKGEKLIIWCEFIGTCDDLSLYFENNGIDNRILYGKCPQDEREVIIREFLNKEKACFNVIIANPHAVGESISLHTTCHNAIYLEQGFNAGVYMQSKDRIHRVGLTDDITTTYYFIQSGDTVDSVVYNRIMEKEQRMLNLIESEEIPLLANNIDYEEDSADDIKAIIKDYYERRKRYI